LERQGFYNAIILPLRNDEIKKAGFVGYISDELSCADVPEADSYELKWIVRLRILYQTIDGIQFVFLTRKIKGEET
jgi:hypothetical protein